MNRFILCLCLTMLAGAVQAQNRRQLANFSQFRHYYNPALTGHEGTVLRAAYRNQWTGFKDAPKTMLASGELDLQDAQGPSRPFAARPQGREQAGPTGARHGLGLILFHDQFGPTKETQAVLSYGAGVQLSERLSLRWGTGLSYTFYRLDGNSLTVDQVNDPRFADVLGSENRSGRADINLGLSLTGQHFYVGYALLDVTEGKVASSGNELLGDLYKRRHVAQVGFRQSITDLVGISLSGIYQHDSQQKSVTEGQVKAIYNNLFWVGGGYRHEMAYTLGAGLRLNQLGIGYTYETPTQDARAIDKSTNEVTLSFYLNPAGQSNGNGRKSSRLTIW
ncbi:PorP/SprF family type IX secretion system membrane protein [Pontibacter chinhatensis]|uniref:Type IX secretion system membrane protein, PorP/SprF family n=1 Tax=Pontibacter chinhatensis TaxID=1436961 RepID=A0A1I2WSZ6_9BACT|nr:PorP/SprF family type IX secretion system membrane protein [Pontibacter chinhatensis]SFH04415.1 type IX secretion system membrane protein, PorP/SprF family [Pontibacter chinhatensis]